MLLTKSERLPPSYTMLAKIPRLFVPAGPTAATAPTFDETMPPVGVSADENAAEENDTDDRVSRRCGQR